MDRLTQLRGGAGGSQDSSLDTSAPSEAYTTANESSKYFSMSEEESSLDISPIKDVSLASTANPEKTTGPDDLISNLTPMPKKSDLLDSYKIGKQIEAANILSGGVAIFDDNENSYDGDELVIDDTADEMDDKSTELKLSENAGLRFQKSEGSESTLGDNEAIGSKDTEVVLQIDGRNVNAIDIGNGLYLYRKDGEEELAAVQIIDDDQQQPSFKFLKVRENAEGNLEVYEEIEIEVPKEVPAKDVKTTGKSASHVPTKDINKFINDSACNKVADRESQALEETPAVITKETGLDPNQDTQAEAKPDVNLNGKMVKFNETRKSPVIHSTPNKEGIPLTKTMVDLHLHPNRHSDKVKTIEVHTEHSKTKHDTPTKSKDSTEDNKASEVICIGKEEKFNDKSITNAEHKVDEMKNSGQVLFETEVKEDENKMGKSESLKPVEEHPKKDQIISSDVNIAEEINTNKDKTEGEKVEINKINLHSISLETTESVKEKIKDNAELEPNKITMAENSSANKANIREIHTLKNVTSSDIFNTKDRKMDVDQVDDLTAQQVSINEHRKEGLMVDKKRNFSLTSKDVESLEQEIVKDSVQNKVQPIKQVVLKESLENEDNVSHDKTHNANASRDTPIGTQLRRAPENINVSTDVKKTEISKVENVVNDLKPICSKDGKSSEVNVSEPDEKIINVRKDDDSKQLDLVMMKKSATEILMKDKSKTEISNKDKSEASKVNEILKKDVIKTNKPPEPVQKISEKAEDKHELNKAAPNIEQKPFNNNHTPVPFGQWTEANRQEFLNKIKESKVSTNTNTKHLKQPNDLNRRDILQKIDSQRQSNIAIAKVQELNAMHLQKLNVKSETKTFTDIQESKAPETEASVSKNIPIPNKKVNKRDPAPSNPLQDFPNTTFSTSTTVATKDVSKPTKRKEINNQDLIDKTIEGIINRALPAKSTEEDTKQSVEETTKKDSTSLLTYQSRHKHPSILDAIEMKMNELHGIPFVERPAHELPLVYNHDIKTYTKNEEPKASINIPIASKIPTLLPYTNKSQQKVTKENVVEIDSEEEIIEHEPITGDIELNKKNVLPIIPTKLQVPETVVTKVSSDISKKGPIITENEFDRFARRNSITYENCLTVNYEGNQPHNVIQTVVEKDVPVKKYSRNEMLLAEAKVKSTHKQQTARHNKHPAKIQMTSKLMPVNEDAFNKTYQSKLKMAYQTTLTAKRQMEPAITIIEDKPVQVVFMDSNSEFMSSQLNVQGNQLSPAKSPKTELDIFTANANTCDSVDLEVTETIINDKTQDESKSKSKHQRKQVLTPVETPELELIEPADLALGAEVSPKKKRKIEDNNSDKSLRNLVPKKTYLLGRSNITEEKVTKPLELTKNPLKETANQNHAVLSHNDDASAIDNLLKAAELIETSERLNTSTNTSVDSASQQNTPVKRGRGRPRKYPLPEGGDKDKVPSPQKKLRLIDAKPPRRGPDTDEKVTSDDEIIKKVNWTMGKINKKIVCPICYKIFRSESVVFKHVKHCSGPSPNRSDSDKRSSKRSRQSLESESKSQGSRSDDMDIDEEKQRSKNDTSKKRNSKDSESPAVSKDVIVIEDSPCMEKVERAELKHVSRKTSTASKATTHTTNIYECDTCSKTFRQLSYLTSHKLQHKDDSKKTETETQINKSVFRCEVCKKEFRKLHHLAQHRLIHNPSSLPFRSNRKSSSENSEKTKPSRSNRKSSSEKSDKTKKEQDKSKQNDESAAFRCEPCDKSFRKLHHLVEHRETHDGINRQKINSLTPTTVERPTPIESLQCDVCKKKFRKLHHLIEHKEQHLETSSEKSDDKSVKSSLSTRDIIHECSLCYMVFPNEHSLNKHTIICQRKKRQSAAKQAKQTEETETAEQSDETPTPEERKTEVNSTPEVNTEEKKDVEKSEPLKEIRNIPPLEKSEEVAKVKDKRQSKDTEMKSVETKTLPIKRDIESIASNDKNVNITPEIPAKIKKIEDISMEGEVIKIVDTPKNKVSIKEKVTPTVTKRQKATPLPPQTAKISAKVESSDDDEVRYMLNPDFEPDEKLFLQIKAKRRDSLSIVRPNSKDLVKRRTSLQLPPKVSRLKPKPVETRIPSASSTANSKVAKTPKTEPVPSTDSDDSDVKYSFPKTNAEKATAQDVKTKEAKTAKEKRKTMTEKRKSLSGIAKRKSVGKPVAAKHNIANTTPTKPIKRRTAEVEHRCDCGQLFSSAALLARHTSLAHTPPRIRRRRSPPPEPTATASKPRKSTDTPKAAVAGKPSDRTDTSTSQTKSTRKSNGDKEQKIPASRKCVGLRTIAHRGVPVPEKMKKFMDKLNKK